MPGLSIDEIIRQAIEEGKFDDLPGRGKPLHLDENPHLDPAWRAAYYLLKSSGFALPWIETLREIEQDVESARSRLASAWEWRASALDEPGKAGFAEAEWQRAVEVFRQQVLALNKRIRDYNLEAPSSHFQRQLVDPEREVRRIMTGNT